MPHAKKIAISIPDKLFREVETTRKITGESRSTFIKEAVEEALKKRNKRVLIEQYINGYRDMPETPEEIAAAEADSRYAFSQEPWE